MLSICRNNLHPTFFCLLSLIWCLDSKPIFSRFSTIAMDPDTTPALAPPPGMVPNFVDPFTLNNYLILTSTVCLALTTVMIMIRIITKAYVIKIVTLEDCKRFVFPTVKQISNFSRCYNICRSWFCSVHRRHACHWLFRMWSASMGRVDHCFLAHSQRMAHSMRNLTSILTQLSCPISRRCSTAL